MNLTTNQTFKNHDRVGTFKLPGKSNCKIHSCIKYIFLNYKIPHSHTKWKLETRKMQETGERVGKGVPT